MSGIAVQLSNPFSTGHDAYGVSLDMYKGPELNNRDFGVTRLGFSPDDQKLHRLKADEHADPVYYFFGFMNHIDTGEKLLIVMNYPYPPVKIDSSERIPEPTPGYHPDSRPTAAMPRRPYVVEDAPFTVEDVRAVFESLGIAAAILFLIVSVFIQLRGCQ